MEDSKSILIQAKNARIIAILADKFAVLGGRKENHLFL